MLGFNPGEPVKAKRKCWKWVVVIKILTFTIAGVKEDSFRRVIS